MPIVHASRYVSYRRLHLRKYAFAVTVVPRQWHTDHELAYVKSWSVVKSYPKYLARKPSRGLADTPRETRPPNIGQDVDESAEVSSSVVDIRIVVLSSAHTAEGLPENL
jgi:hypothetical protein